MRMIPLKHNHEFSSLCAWTCWILTAPPWICVFNVAMKQETFANISTVYALLRALTFLHAESRFQTLAEFREQQKAACEKVRAEVLDPELCASSGYWTFTGAQTVSQLGQRTLGKIELRACAGTAGDTGSRTRRSRQAGERCNLPV